MNYCSVCGKQMIAAHPYCFHLREEKERLEQALLQIEFRIFMLQHPIEGFEEEKQ